jgi:preprotein translocase subunit YajC
MDTQFAWAILIVSYAAILVLFYLFVIKPRRDAARRHKQLVESLSRGDEIVTAGGIHGRVVSVKDKTCVVEIARDTQITLERGAVRSRQEESD